MSVIIVRRALDSSRYFFLQAFAKANGLELVVDRRAQDRRRIERPVPGDRRTDNRRSHPPRTWAEGDFVVVPALDDSAEQQAEPAAAPRKKLRIFPRLVR